MSDFRAELRRTYPIPTIWIALGSEERVVQLSEAVRIYLLLNDLFREATSHIDETALQLQRQADRERNAMEASQ